MQIVKKYKSHLYPHCEVRLMAVADKRISEDYPLYDMSLRIINWYDVLQCLQRIHNGRYIVVYSYDVL